MSVLQNKLVPVDYDGNGTADLGFFREVAPDRGQLSVWLSALSTGLFPVKATVGGLFRYANANLGLLGDGFIPGFAGPVNFFFSGPAPLFPDFNGDGKTDQIFGSLLFSNPLDPTTFQGYELFTWFMDGTGVIGQQPIVTSSGSNALVREEWADPFLYNIKGQGPLGDFNGDGTTDILFLRQNEGSGTTDVAFWLIQNGTAVTRQTIGSAGVGWSLVNTNDFDGNGTTDLLFTQDAGGNTTNIGIWTQNGIQSLSRSTAGTAGAGWELIDTNDFNGNGNADLLFAQDLEGGGKSYGIWTMNGTQVLSKGTIGGSNNSDWELLDHNDFNGDGKADLLFGRPLDSGVTELAVWLLDGTNSPIAQQSLGTSGAAGWEFFASGDANGDGIADLAFFNSATQQVGTWLLGSNGQPFQKNIGGTVDVANGWLPPFIQPDFDVPPFPQVPVDFLVA